MWNYLLDIVNVNFMSYRLQSELYRSSDAIELSTPSLDLASVGTIYTGLQQKGQHVEVGSQQFTVCLCKLWSRSEANWSVHENRIFFHFFPHFSLDLPFSFHQSFPLPHLHHRPAVAISSLSLVSGHLPVANFWLLHAWLNDCHYPTTFVCPTA